MKLVAGLLLLCRNRSCWLVPFVSLLLTACGGGGGSDSETQVAATLPSNDPPPQSMPTELEDDTTSHTFLTDHFSGSQNCSLCHDGLQDQSGKDVSIVADWQATMMANSSRDPFWRAKVASEVIRNPAFQEEIETACGRCHVPMANTEAAFAGGSATLFEDGLLHPDNPLFDAATEGVSCTLCHQIEDSPALGTDAGFSGNFSIPDDFGVDRLLYGQYDNPLTTPMRNQVAFTPAESAHISSSEVCAGCHNLSTRVVDPQGNLTDQMFPEQMVYTEWEHSQFADTQSCQDCHMPVASGDIAISTRPMNGLSPRPDFARHTFAGANTYMLDILSENAEQLNVTPARFDTAITEARTLLTSTVTLSLEDVASVGGDLDFTIRLTNRSGHKFPTGYPSRRAWLHVRITSNASGNTVFESGAINAMGEIAGLASDAAFGEYEPHYELITRSDQVQSYETIMEDIDGNLTYTLMEAAGYRKDNRLLPAGMDKASVPLTIQAQGEAVADLDFVGGGDQVRYQVSGLASDSYTIEASLNYQTLAFGFARDLFTDMDDPRVALFSDLNDTARLRFETVASDSDSIDL